MRISVKCNTCDKELEITETAIAPGCYDVVLTVIPCRSKSCTDCSDCEDMELLKIYREGRKQLLLNLKELENETVKTESSDTAAPVKPDS